jgi:glycerol-3-phosphate O-acyltransferase
MNGEKIKPLGKPQRITRLNWLAKLLGSLDFYANELGERHSRVFSYFFDRIFGEIKIESEKIDKLRHFAARGRLIYALPYRSPLDFLFLNARLRYPGLPMPEIAYNINVYRFQPFRKMLKLLLARVVYWVNFRAWPDPYSNKYYLRRYREGAGFVASIEDPASFAQLMANPTHDPFYHLIKLWRKHRETVVIIPIFPVFEKGPTRQDKSILDIFIGPKDRPGRLRKIVHYLRYYHRAFLEVADPITVDMFLARPDQQGLTDEEAAFNLRKELWEHAVREQRVIRGPVQKQRTQIMESVLRAPEVLKVVRSEVKRQGKPFSAIRRQGATYINEMAAAYSQSMVEFLDRVLGWVWQNLYNGVQVDEEGLSRVREAAKRFPLVYVPSHKSHIDYLVLSWVLYNRNLAPPHIAAGINLDTWPIGLIFRKSGAFFMRRTFRDNRLYAVIFAKYIEVLIREGYNLEFFIEGGRSRTGRLLRPKMGMVKYVVEAFENNAARDVMFVPVYIGYDQIIEEGEYLEEMHGVKKPKGNLLDLLKNRSLIRKRYGRIYINFAEPVSLKQHLERVMERAPAPEERLNLATGDLAESIIQGINSQQVVTPFALMAAALLTSPAKAIGRSELLNALALFHQYLLATGARFSGSLDNFNRAMEEVIAYFESRKLLEVEAGDDAEEPFYTLPEDHRLSLEMYKNMILHHFLPMSFTALSLLSADYGECSETKLNEDYRFLKELFKFEFIHDPAAGDHEAIERCLAYLADGRHLEISVAGPHRHCLVTAKGREEVVYFAAMLTNFLEAYGIVLNALPKLNDQAESEKEFLARLRRIGQRLYKQGQVLRPEALSLLLFENALRFARDRGLLMARENDGKQLLVYDQEADDLRNQLLTHISKFIRVEKYHYLDKGSD